MNFAFLIRSKVTHSLCDWVFNLLSARRAGSVVLHNSAVAEYCGPKATTASIYRVHPRVAARPLRVVRIVEKGQARSDVGRMVISGRMADVCDELDRLAAREATENGLMGRAVAVGC